MAGAWQAAHASETRAVRNIQHNLTPSPLRVVTEIGPVIGVFGIVVPFPPTV